MGVEMGREFRRKRTNIYAMGLWPGAVKTETITQMYKDGTGSLNNDPKNDQRNYDICMAEVVKRLDDKKYMKSVNAKIVWTCDLGKEFGLKDVDGRVIPSYLQVNVMLKMAVWNKLASVVPNFVKVPKWLFVKDAFGKRFR